MDTNEWIVQILDYNEHIELSKSRRTKYFKKGDKIPNKYTKGGLNSLFNKEGFFIDSTGNKIIKNPKSAGTSKRWKINGQCLYSGTLHPFARKKAASQVHQYLRPYIKPLPKFVLGVGEYLAIELEIHNKVGKGDWDVSNKWPWIKWFEDTLTESNKIADDNIKIVRDSGRIKFFESDTPKLLFRIYKINDKHERI